MPMTVICITQTLMTFVCRHSVATDEEIENARAGKVPSVADEMNSSEKPRSRETKSPEGKDFEKADRRSNSKRVNVSSPESTDTPQLEMPFSASSVNINGVVSAPIFMLFITRQRA